MPRTEIVTRTLYKFDELSDTAKGKALDRLYDINVDHDWWEFTYEDAERIGLKLKAFDISRSNYIEGMLMEDPRAVAANIIRDHGPECETRKVAEKFLTDIGPNTEVLDYDATEKMEEIADAFARALKEEYLSILRKEYEYLTSKDAIIETIEANDYEFTEDGALA